jgi:hypothetical protein
LAKWSPRRALHQAGDADLVDHLGELARARRPHQGAARIGGDDLFCARERLSVAPHITKGAPFSALAWLPDTGASIPEAAPQGGA